MSCGIGLSSDDGVPSVSQITAQFKSKELESEQRRGETVKMAQNVERLKVEFLKQMQAEELRMQEEIQAMQHQHTVEHERYQVCIQPGGEVSKQCIQTDAFKHCKQSVAHASTLGGGGLRL